MAAASTATNSPALSAMLTQFQFKFQPFCGAPVTASKPVLVTGGIRSLSPGLPGAVPVLWLWRGSGGRMKSDPPSRAKVGMTGPEVKKEICPSLASDDSTGMSETAGDGQCTATFQQAQHPGLLKFSSLD